MNTDGRVIFWTLFAVAIGYGINPSIGILTLVVVLGVLNKDRVADAARALTDAAQSLSDTTHRLQTKIASVVSLSDNSDSDQSDAVPLDDKRSASPSKEPHQSVTALYINNKNSSAVTLPPPSVFDPASARPSPYAVPIGYDHTGIYRWIDFANDALHIGLYGTSGCGKDHLLRVWFAALLDAPRVKWAILDGKGDWLTPNIARLPQMLFRPAGGYGEEGQQRILDAIQTINQEAVRRFNLVLKAGVRSAEEYNQTAGADALPLLIILITDVIDATEETERLLISLVSKARSLGIRVIVSMQTPTGKRTEWRMNLSTLISGALVDGSQDAPALGVRDVATLKFRPSHLPPPPGERGLFVVRHNNEQMLIRSPVLTRDFDELVNEHNSGSDNTLLEALLAMLEAPEDDGDETGDGWDAGDAGDAGDAEDGDGDGDGDGDTEGGKLAVLGTSEDVGDGDGDRDTEDLPEAVRLGVLATLVAAGYTREQARAAGIRFRNQEWTELKRRHNTQA